MANRNYFRVILSNEFLGISKEISAPNRYELERRIENQKRIWNEKVERELIKQNKEEMKNNAEQLTKNDERKMKEYENIAKKCYFQRSSEYYDSLIDNKEYEKYVSKLVCPTIEQINEELEVPKKSFLEILFKQKKINRIQKEEEAKKLLEERTEKYNQDLKLEKN